MCCSCSRTFPTVQKILNILTRFTRSSQNPHHPHKILNILTKFTWYSQILIILIKSTWSSQNSHYSHKIYMILTKFSWPSQNQAQKSLLDSSDINSPFILWMYLQFSPSGLPDDTIMPYSDKVYAFSVLSNGREKRQLYLLCPFFCLSVGPHVPARLPLDRFHWNL
jgi:hypothetical protein